MDRTEALTALQRWYDYDRIGGETWAKRYPTVEDEAREYHAANGHHTLAEHAADHLDLYIEAAARDALAAMLLIEAA